MRVFDPNVARTVLRELAGGRPYIFENAAEIQQLEQFQACKLLQLSYPYKEIPDATAQGVTVTTITGECMQYVQAALDDQRWPEVEQVLRDMEC